MINIFSLNNVRDQKEINRFQIYKRVLKKCHHRIKTISNKGESFGFYVVPEYIYGIPKYDTLNCANYIVNKLRNNGFKVIYTYPNLLFISWNHVPSEYKTSANKCIENNIEKKEKAKSISDNNFRLIEDYKPSKNFLRKVVKSNHIKRITY